MKRNEFYSYYLILIPVSLSLHKKKVIRYISYFVVMRSLVHLISVLQKKSMYFVTLSPNKVLGIHDHSKPHTKKQIILFKLKKPT